MDKKKLYRFKLVHENMWNAEQHLASVHASTDDYINSITLIHGLRFNQINITIDQIF